MRDVRVAEVAATQFNRVSRAQLNAVIVEQRVFAVAPVLTHDAWGAWMGATLTAPNSFLSHGSASAAWEFLDVSQPYVSVTRPGSGGPRQHGGVLVYRSLTLDRETTALKGVPITTVPRTLVDLAAHLTERRLAR